MTWSFAPIIVLVFVAIAPGHSLPSRSVVEVQDERIIGGDVTDIALFPYQIALFHYDSYRCGGSILNENFILTAAHCVQDVSYATSLAIRAGSSNRESGGQFLNAAKSLFEPRFTMEHLHYDVALIKLASSLVLDALARPIQLVDVGSEPKRGSHITLSGWGVTSEGSDTAADVIRTTKVKTVSRWLCAIPYFFVNKLTKTMFCAAALGKDTCQGDSGGPAVNDEGKQVGIVSFGIGCAKVLFPGVYTNLANAEVRSFIDNTLKTL